METVCRTPGRKLKFTESKPSRLIQEKGLAESTEHLQTGYIQFSMPLGCSVGRQCCRFSLLSRPQVDFLPGKGIGN